jgi:hypothetical protein
MKRTNEVFLVLMGKQQGNVFYVRKDSVEYREDWYWLLKVCKTDKEASALIDDYYDVKPYALEHAIVRSMGKPVSYPDSCPLCGKENLPSRYSPGMVRDLMEATGECFSCSHWTEMLITQYYPGKSVIADGNHYLVGAAGVDEYARGFSGKSFRIIREGKTILTDNLWHQGKIPENFRRVMKDNSTIARI